MKVNKITVYTVGDTEGVLNVLTEALTKNGTYLWNATTTTLFDLKDLGDVTLDDKSDSELNEGIEQYYPFDAMLDDNPQEQALFVFFEDVGNLRYGPLSSACMMCKHKTESCMNREFSKMDMTDDSKRPHIIVACNSFSPLEL